jgi:hypothetical protein
MNILDLLIPQAMEGQRGRARQKFQAGLQQPEVFQTESMPIPQMVGAYEKGYGMPYPTQPGQSPTAAIEGMTTDPNRQTTIQPPENLPIEYISPRSLEEGSMRSAGMQGRAGMEGKISGLEYGGGQMPRLEGFFEDAGEDIEEYDIPASMGQFQRHEPTEPGKSYADPYWDLKTQSLLQKETETGEVSRVAGAPAAGGGGGAGDDPEADEYKRALDTYKALNQRLDPMTAMMIERMGSAALKDPNVQARIKGTLSEPEQRQHEYALGFMEYYNKKTQDKYRTGQIPSQVSDQEAATAEGFMQRKGLQ